MEIVNLINEIEVLLNNNLVNVCTSILATIIVAMAKVPYIIIKKVCERISWQDKKGVDYIIAYSYRSEKKADMLRDSIKFLANANVLLVPCIFMIAVLGIAAIFLQLAKLYIFMLVLGTSGVSIYFVYAKTLGEKSKRNENISNIIIVIVLFLLFSILISAVGVCQNENLYYYTTIISLILFFICIYSFKVEFEAQNCILEIIKFIKYLILVVIYMLFSKELNINVISNSLWVWVIFCTIEYTYTFFSEKYLLPYTIKCTDKIYITYKNIIQMKDKKVKFLAEDKSVCIIANEEIDCITYEMENPKRYRRNNQIRAMYTTKDGKKHICDHYVYLGKEWIEFRKTNDRKIEATILPANQINCIWQGN